MAPPVTARWPQVSPQAVVNNRIVMAAVNFIADMIIPLGSPETGRMALWRAAEAAIRRPARRGRPGWVARQE